MESFDLGPCSSCSHAAIVEVKEKEDPVLYRYCACCWEIHLVKEEREMVIRFEHDRQVRRRG